MAEVFCFVPAKIFSICDPGVCLIPTNRYRPFHRKGSEMMSRSLINRNRTNRKVAAIRNPSERNGSRVCSTFQKVYALTDPDVLISNKNDGLKRRSYRFQTENGGLVKVSVGAKQSTYFEVSDLPLGLNEHHLAVRWQTFRSDSLCQLEPSDSSKSCEALLSQTSPGRHSSELEIDYPDIPAYLSFFIYSSFSIDGSDGIVLRSSRKTNFRVPVGFTPGKPAPLGITFCDDGTVNFSLFSRNAERVILCLFEDHSEKPSLEIELDPYVHKTGDIWHVSLENVSNYVSYGFRCNGNSDMYLDPYAKAVRSFSQGNSDFFLGELRKTSSFDWSGDIHLCIPTEKLVIYRLNVGSFTRDKSSSLPDSTAGTFVGIIEKIQYLKKLGVNAILLEPIFFFNEEQGPYFPHSFFAPMNKYGPRGDSESARNSMKEMVKCLHVNGIEVLLEVIFSHTAEGAGIHGIDRLSYYVDDDKRLGARSLLNCDKQIVQKMIIDSLHHWVIDFHIDGFCFVNGLHFRCNLSRSSLIESIAFDPILSNTRLIADSWSPHDMLSHEMNFPHWKRWSEINSRFCKDVRNFLRGEGHLSDLATRLCGSGDMFSDSRGPTYSFNFVTRNSGLSLVDLVSFSGGKLSSELSWNCGAHGPTSNVVILETRLRQIRNFLFLLFVSLGVPVLNMGDECGMSAGGSTSYGDRCLFDWDYLETSFACQITQFIFFLVSLRNRRNDLFQRRVFHQVKNIRWHGANHSEPKWEDPSSKFLAFSLKADNGEKAFDSVEGDIFIAFNAGDMPSTVVLPETPEPYKWIRLVDTSYPFPGFFSNGDDPDSSSFSEVESYELKAHTFCLFEARMND